MYTSAFVSDAQHENTFTFTVVLFQAGSNSITLIQNILSDIIRGI